VSFLFSIGRRTAYQKEIFVLIGGSFNSVMKQSINGPLFAFARILSLLRLVWQFHNSILNPIFVAFEEDQKI
jgi:hypothetical protein